MAGPRESVRRPPAPRGLVAGSAPYLTRCRRRARGPAARRRGPVRRSGALWRAGLRPRPGWARGQGSERAQGLGLCGEGEPDDFAVGGGVGAPAVAEVGDHGQAAAAFGEGAWPPEAGQARVVVGDGRGELTAGPAQLQHTHVVACGVPVDVGEQFTHTEADRLDDRVETPVPQVRGDDPAHLGYAVRRRAQVQGVLAGMFDGDHCCSLVRRERLVGRSRVRHHARATKSSRMSTARIPPACRVRRQTQQERRMGLR